MPKPARVQTLQKSVVTVVPAVKPPSKASLANQALLQQIVRARFLYALGGIIVSAVFLGCVYLWRRGELPEEGFGYLLVSSWVSLVLLIAASKANCEIKLLTLLELVESQAQKSTDREDE